jgi:Ca-activated chloride channel family protein
MLSGPRVLFLLFLVAILVIASQALAQSSDPVHINPGDKVEESSAAHKTASGEHRPLRVDVDLVLVPVSVVDAANRPVTTLRKQDFTVYEGNEQQPLRYFSTEDAPISVGILLDLSFSMKDKIETARQALHQFFANCNPDDDYFVVGFSNRPSLLSDSTHSTASIENEVALAVPAGNTALLDAIYVGVSKLRTARYKRRALVIISDGGDNHSRYTAAEIRRMVQEEDVEIYALGIFSRIFKSYEEWTGERLLNGITEITGGHTVTVSNVEELPMQAANISRELRNQYILGYQPNRAPHSSKWRKIRVRVAPPAEGVSLHVYSKQGYLSADD